MKSQGRRGLFCSLMTERKENIKKKLSSGRKKIGYASNILLGINESRRGYRRAYVSKLVTKVGCFIPQLLSFFTFTHNIL